MTNNNVMQLQDGQVVLMLLKFGLCGASKRLNGMLKAVGVKNSQVTIVCVM